METLRNWIFASIEGEEIEGIVIGEYSSYRKTFNTSDFKNILLSFSDPKIQKCLDQPFDHGFGGGECPPCVVWTKSWIVSIGEYDGSVYPFRIPRNPISHVVCMSGECLENI